MATIKKNNQHLKFILVLGVMLFFSLGLISIDAGITGYSIDDFYIFVNNEALNTPLITLNSTSNTSLGGTLVAS